MLSVSDEPARVGCDWRVRWLAYGYALLVALCLGHFLLGLPIQLSDSFGQMLKLSASWGDLLRGTHAARVSAPADVGRAQAGE